MAWLNPLEGTIYVEAEARIGEAIVTLGSVKIFADSNSLKKYAVTYSADPGAAAMVLGRGHIRSIRYFPRRLSDSELQALTA